MTNYREIRYQSPDGLELFARDYPSADPQALTILCMPGLTRNAADFEPAVEYLWPQFRMLCVDQRGRGDSEWDPHPQNYQPAVYVEDMFALLDTVNASNVVLFGTSLGGLMAMIMNAMQPGRFRGLILNDVGPEVEPAGLARIMSYVGKDKTMTSWADAIENTRWIGEAAYPEFQSADWEQLARRIYRENPEGVPQLLYDPTIAQPIAASEDNAVPDNLWSIFDQARNVPALVIRGALSDILGAETVSEMRQRKPDLRAVDVPGVGHAPILDEPVAVEAVQAFLTDLPPRSENNL